MLSRFIVLHPHGSENLKVSEGVVDEMLRRYLERGRGEEEGEAWSQEFLMSLVDIAFSFVEMIPIVLPEKKEDRTLAYVVRSLDLRQEGKKWCAEAIVNGKRFSIKDKDPVSALSKVVFEASVSWMESEKKLVELFSFQDGTEERDNGGDHGEGVDPREGKEGH